MTEPAPTPDLAAPDPTAPVVVAPMASAEDADAFRSLNEEWISRLFSLEDEDRRTLGDPGNEIVARGGQVLIARSAGLVVGCVALVPAAPGVFELSKMTVAPSARGRGIGRVVVEQALRWAREAGATSVFLGSSTRLADAVHLYESVGFVHVTRDELGPMPYRRADVFMRYALVAAG